MKTRDVSDFSLCVVCFKLLQKPSLISISIRQSTMIHILAREWNCQEDPLRNPVTLGKGISRGYRHPYRSFTCAKVLSKVAASGKTIGPWALRTFLNRGNSKQFPGQHDICILPDSELLTANWTVLLDEIARSLLTRQPNDPAATHSTLPYPRAY